MDYKYINQLLERYWECQTTLEEEAILRAFFSQEDIPASLLPYRNLFVYELTETKEDVLDDAFDARMYSLIGKAEPVKARRISLTQRMRPLFRAVAVVAVILTLANAIQMSFSDNGGNENISGTEATGGNGVSVAKCDTAVMDSVRRSSLSTRDMAVPAQSEDIHHIDNQAFIMK
jgi:hypothetical protein